MTENYGTCSHVLPGDPLAAGTVGPPLPSVEMKLVDVPSLGYFSEDEPNPRGEFCCRGSSCFRGYYKGMLLLLLHAADAGSVDYNQMRRIRKKHWMKKVGCILEISPSLMPVDASKLSTVLR